MDDLNWILKQIRPCDTDRPFIFVSYSSEDSALVWRDVLTFQQRGYNVWLDEKNVDKTAESWRSSALESIKDRDCKLVLFYVSGSSLCSEPCLNELRETTSRETKLYHKMQPVKFVAVDVEEIGDITEFYGKVFDRISAAETDKAEFNRRAKVLGAFLEQFFNSNNERVRIRPRSEPERKGDYYSDIENSFPEETRVYDPRPEGAPEPVGTCPWCGGTVEEDGEGFRCSSRTCGFAMRKEDGPFGSGKVELTAGRAAALLSGEGVVIGRACDARTHEFLDEIVKLRKDDGKQVSYYTEVRREQ